MKQTQSILQWGSLTLDQDVKSIDAVQEVQFVRNLLWKIDPSYFSQWQGGRGTESLTQVLQTIGKYFQQEIGTDIKDHIDKLNVYKHPMEVWELCLGIAIKGNNRGENITLILDMDHAIQAELVGIVSEIIDKFGQNAANTNIPEVDEDKEEDDPEMTSQQKMLLDLAKENQELNEYINQLQEQLEKQKLQTQTVTKQKTDVEHRLEMLMHEKTAFIEILAQANRTESRIFDDGEETALRSTSLSELANDISRLVRGLNKRIEDEREKVSVLDETLRMTKREAIKIAQENQNYLLQMDNLNAYEAEIDKMRDQVSQMFSQNSQLIDRITEMEEERIRLLQTIQQASQQKPLEDLRQTQDKELFQTQRRHKERKSQNAHSSFSSNDEKIKGYGYKEHGRDSVEPDIHQIKDELRQPKLRTKLQREIQHLKKTNEHLKQQNVTLKKSNESLQKSANQFVAGNKEVISRWEDDYQDLLEKMNELTAKHENKEEKQTQQIGIQPIAEEPVASSSSIIDEYQVDQAQPKEQEEPEIKPKQSAVEVIIEPVSAPQKKSQSNDSLWEQIAMKLKGVIRTFKERQFSYQNTIHQLRTQNTRLLGIRQESYQQQSPRQVKPRNQSESLVSIKENPAPQPLKSQEHEVFLSLIRGNSQEGLTSNERQRLTQLSRMSFGSVKEGEDLDEQMLQRRRIGASIFYNTGSKLIQELNQKAEGFQADQMTNLNAKLFNSIYSNLDSLQAQQNSEATAKSKELEESLKRQIELIQEQYDQLNKNYREIFNKLQLYSEQFNQSQNTKIEYQQILQKLKMTEEQIKTDQQAQIVKLRLINNQLHQGLAEAAAEKQQILAMVHQIIASKAALNTKENYQNNYKHILKGLEEIKLKYNEMMVSPMEFLNLKFEGQQEGGQSEKFYQLYLKEKQKAKQYSMELELLSCTLLEYRNILEF